jgi:hypothetical protein
MLVNPMPDITAPDTADRRTNRRFSLRLAVKCRRIEPRFLLDRIIIGESLNISSKGLLFAATEAFLPGQVVEAFIDWPMLLDDHIRLTLVVEGVVVRTGEDRAAIRIEKYEFRTRGVAKSRPAAHEAAAMHIPEAMQASQLPRN